MFLPFQTQKLFLSYTLPPPHTLSLLTLVAEKRWNVFFVGRGGGGGGGGPQKKGEKLSALKILLSLFLCVCVVERDPWGMEVSEEF